MQRTVVGVWPPSILTMWTKSLASTSMSKNTVRFQTFLVLRFAHHVTVRGENLDAVDEGDIFEILEQAEERARSSSPPPLPEKIELEKVILDRSVGLVEPGDVVELHHSSDAEDRDLPRGDFLLVRQIKEELETGDISFCGYRLRRTAHMAPMFNRESSRSHLQSENLLTDIQAGPTNSSCSFTRGKMTPDPSTNRRWKRSVPKKSSASANVSSRTSETVL